MSRINNDVITDIKDKIYISDWYKKTKKNKIKMEKEIEKLNKKKPWRYIIQYAMILKWESIQDFNSLNY